MLAYLDTSFLVSIVFGEPGWRRRQKILHGMGKVFSCELLVAEFLAIARREKLSAVERDSALDGVTIVIPDRTIRPEIETVLRSGYLRGADLWHLACACYVSPKPQELAFLSCDERQRKIAAQIGFDAD